MFDLKCNKCNVGHEKEFLDTLYESNIKSETWRAVLLAVCHVLNLSTSKNYRTHCHLSHPFFPSVPPSSSRSLSSTTTPRICLRQLTSKIFHASQYRPSAPRDHKHLFNSVLIV